MIIAHLPAGYILTKLMSSNFKADRSRFLWFFGLLASVLPDIDIFWGYLSGNSSLNHREYPTHWPLAWLAAFFVSGAVMIAFKRRDLLVFPLVIGANIALHLTVDTLAAPVYYGAPFTWEPLQFIEVPDLYGWWLWNFLRHWTFQLELLIWASAVIIFGLSGGKSANC